MPQVPTLQPNVGLAVGQPRVAPSSTSVEGFGGGEAGRGNALIGLGEALSNIAIQQQAKINQANVMKAQADLTLQFNENLRSQYQKFGANALGKPATENSEAVPSASEDFANFARNTLQGAMGNMDNDLQRQKLQEWYSSNFPNYLQKVATHQNQQYNTYLTESFNSDIRANMDTFVGNVKLGDYNGAERSFEQANNTLQTQLTWQGADAKTRKQATQNLLYSNAEATVKSLIDDSRAQEAYAFVNHFAGRFTPNQLETLRAMIRPEAIKVQADDLATQIYNDPAMKGVDGRLDWTKAMAAAQKLSTVTKMVGGSDLISAIGGQESGGDYNAVNGRTGASGKYQILPSNWPEWSAEAGIPNAEMTPENQEIVARFKITQYQQQYGDEGAMVAWYSGAGNAERWVNGETTDVYGRPWTAKNGNGDEPSISEYVEEVSGRMGTGGTQVVERNDTEYNAIMAKLRELEQQEKLNYSARVNAAADAMAQAQQSGQIQTLADAQRVGTQISRNLGIRPSDVAGVISIGTEAVGLQNRISSEQQSSDYNDALEAILNGDINTENELRVKYPNLDATHRANLINTAIAPKYKWADETTKTLVNGTLDASKYAGDNIVKAATYQYISDKVKLYVDKNGHKPSMWEIQDFAVEAVHNAARVEYQGTGRFGGREETSVPNALFTGLNIHPRMVDGELRYYDENGREYEYDYTFQRFNRKD